MIPHTPKHWFCHQNHVSSMFRSLTSYNPSTQFLTFRSIWASENGLNWFPISQNIGFVTRTISLAGSEAELEFHFLKFLLTSYSPSTQFLAVRSIWGFCKWSQMIPHTPKHWFCHQNHVSSMLRTWVTPKVRISLLEAKILPPWRVPWLATVPTSPPWPTYQSVASENGLK